jgi:DNA ligase D
MPSPSTEIEVGPHTVRISNPDRVYFSARGETKLDLVKYYLSVGPGIVRALRERPCMLHRYPDGVDGEKIYQKRLPKGAPEWVETVEVRFPSGRTADELCVTELAAVAWAVQMSTVEFHPWHSRRADTEKPDELRIDLDPGPGAALDECKQVAGVVHEVLTELGAVGWPKTSGSKGVHVYVRIEPRFGFREVRRAALAFAREVERRAPSSVTTAWWKEERGQQVFVDYNQNARDRTIRSAYSLRGDPTAPVSTPLTWDEVPYADPHDFTIDTVPARFAELGDVHAGIDDDPWSIEPLLEWADRDEQDRGLGDAPYPPNFPKMEGEPMRVQPSRARKAD